MESLRWAALILNILWGLQELLLLIGSDLWVGPVDLLTLALTLLLLLPFLSIGAILLPRARHFSRFVLLLNAGVVTLLLLNLLRLSVDGPHLGSVESTELFLSFLALIPLTLNCVYLLKVLWNRP
jgi:hypothetical protein